MNSLTAPRRPSAPLRQSTDPEISLGLRGLSSSASPGSAATLSSPARKRKPVPTPRNTLRKPAARKADGTSVASSSPEDSGISDEPKAEKAGGGEDPEDILSALERIPGVGTLRSGQGSLQSSVAGSLPSLSTDKVKREESTHSLGSSQSSGQHSMKSTDVDGLKEALRRGSSVRSNGTSTLAHPPGKSRRGSDEAPDSAIGTGDSSRLMSTSDSKPDSPIKQATTDEKDPGSPAAKASPSGDATLLSDEERNMILTTDNIEDLYEAALGGRPRSPPEEKEGMKSGEGGAKSDLKDQRLSTIVIQARPLPDLPELKLKSPSPSCAPSKSLSSPANADANEIKTIGSSLPDEEDGVYSTLLSPDHYSDLQPTTDISVARKDPAISSCRTLNPPRRRLPPIVDHNDDDEVGPGRFKTFSARKSTTLQVDPAEPNSTSTLLVKKPRRPFMEDSSTNYLTLTGTMMKRKNQRNRSRAISPQLQQQLSQTQDAELAAALAVAAEEDKTYDVHLTLTAEAIRAMEKRIHAKYHDRCFCGLNRGLHVFLLSLCAFPFALIYATLQAFYLGTLTWYNVFIHYNEERSCLHKLLSPGILLLYPLWIIPCTIVIGLFGALFQVSWYFDSWLDALRTPDGGFFRWFCEDFVGLTDCSPYRVILLSSSDYERPCTGATNI